LQFLHLFGHVNDSEQIVACDSSNFELHRINSQSQGEVHADLGDAVMISELYELGLVELFPLKQMVMLLEPYQEIVSEEVRLDFDWVIRELVQL
jgi:hypothetical protein